MQDINKTPMNNILHAVQEVSLISVLFLPKLSYFPLVHGKSQIAVMKNLQIVIIYPH